MALTHSRPAEPGAPAPGFDLPGIDGKRYTLDDFADARALLVAFICNHCPYVVAIQDRLARLAREFAPKGARVVAINSNDWSRYPADSPEAMKEQARRVGFEFPYLYDETQKAARDFDAVCTPDFYLYSNGAKGFELRYRGRLDDNWKDPGAVTRRELAEAIEAVVAGKPVRPEQLSSMGCSIKWR